MKKTTKALALVLCAMLLVVGSVMGTLAYLTSEAEVTNTFTVGKVEISMDEAYVTEYGKPVTGSWTDADKDGMVDDGEITDNLTEVNDPQSALRVIGNAYKLIPGHTYTKDPTIIVGADSEKCWLFVKIENGLGTDAVIGGFDNTKWTQIDSENNIWAYNIEVEANDTVTVFTSFTFGENANPETHADKNIKVTAYAIQADGLEEKTSVQRWALIPQN